MPLILKHVSIVQKKKDDKAVNICFKKLRTAVVFKLYIKAFLDLAKNSPNPTLFL
jgi:hypothetical protein